MFCIAAFSVISLELSGIMLGVTCERVVTNISHAFMKNELHHLSVPSSRTFLATDVFDCTSQCLLLPSCVSVNLALMAEADGRYWCELLSSDKYINSEDFNKNMTSRHLFKKSHCVSAPCQNEGTCVANYQDDTFKCLCLQGFIGDYCETGATSCKQLYEAKKFNKTQMATLRFGSTPTSVMCHVGDFGCGPGAWTTVLKTDGNKKTFRFDSAYWSNTNEYNLDGGSTGFDTQETKLSTYWNTPFSQICLGMKVSEQLNFVVLNKQASSLFSLIADGSYRSTSLARYTWKTLLGSKGSLQLRCNKQGFNSVCKQCRVRIGIVSNNEYNCESCDSRIGFGASGPPYDSSTCGNEAKWYPDNGNRNIKAMGYVLVQ